MMKKMMMDEKKSMAGNIPMVELNGTCYTQTMPMLRYFCKKMGKCCGKTMEEDYCLDKIADMCADWIGSWVEFCFMNRGADYNKNHMEVVCPKYMACMENFCMAGK
jgi:hypothetical protein